MRDSTRLQLSLTSGNDEADGLLLAGTLAPQQNILNTDVLLDSLAAEVLPVNKRSQLGSKVTLREDVVGNVRKPLQAVRRVRVGNKLDTLCDNACRGIIEVNIAEPQSGWDVLCIILRQRLVVRRLRFILTDHQLQCTLLASSDTLVDEVLDDMARLDLLAILLLPPSRRAVLGLDKALTKDYNMDLMSFVRSGPRQGNKHTMFEHILQVNELVVLELEFHQLSGCGQMSP